MIVSSIYAKDDISKYPEAIRTAIEYLKANDFTKMETGTYEIRGREIYAQVIDAQTEAAELRKPEVHEKYIDVQFLVSGKEHLGFTWDTGDYEVEQRLEERDLIFYKSVRNEGFIEAVPGCYCIFFPADVHRPAVAADQPMTIRKVVVKVSTALIGTCVL